jgi:hypothetical protein
MITIQKIAANFRRVGNDFENLSQKDLQALILFAVSAALVMCIIIMLHGTAANMAQPV